MCARFERRRKLFVFDFNETKILNRGGLDDCPSCIVARWIAFAFRTPALIHCLNRGGNLLLWPSCFGGDGAAFAGGFEDGGALAFEVGLHPPQRRHPRLQPRELLLNLRHNPPLLRLGSWKKSFEGTNVAWSHRRIKSALNLLAQRINEIIRLNSVEKKSRFGVLCAQNMKTS